MLFILNFYNKFILQYNGLIDILYFTLPRKFCYNMV